jgi:predicted DNA binding CopG/RHH family protein
MQCEMSELSDDDIITSIENGEWKSIADFETMKKTLMRAASETALKDYRINVRISRKDVEALKTKALEEGIPYQTLVTSILHKYVTGRLRDQDRAPLPEGT